MDIPHRISRKVKNLTNRNKTQRIILAWIKRITIIIFGAIIFLSHPSWASPNVDLKIIKASNAKEKFVSPQLKSIYPQLKASFVKYTRFKHIKSVKLNLDAKAKKTVKLNKKLSLKLKATSIHQKMITLDIHIPNKKMKHTVKAKRGKLFFEAFKWK